MMETSGQQRDRRTRARSPAERPARPERLAEALLASEEIHRGRTVDDVLVRIARGVQRLGFETAVVNVRDPASDRLLVRATAGLTPDEEALLRSTSYRWSDLSKVLLDQFRVSRSYWIPSGTVDWDDLPSIVPELPATQGGPPDRWDPEDALVVPILARDGETIGLLSVDRPHDRRVPSVGQIQILEMFANQAATAIENARLFDELQQQLVERQRARDALERTKRRIERLHSAAHRLAVCGTEEAAYRLTVSAAETILSFTFCTLFGCDGDRLVLRAASANYTEGLPREIPLDGDGGIATRTHLERRTFVIERFDAVPEARPTLPHHRSGISAPIGSIGIFQAISLEEAAYSNEDARLLELLVGHTAAAIERIRLQRELREQAMRDPLTGAFNRRYFNEVIEREIRRSQRYAHPISFLMTDVNRFKEVNDRFGHQTGDWVLREVARILQGEIREIDSVVRYGGDEFLLVLPETNGRPASDAVRDRIAASVAECQTIQDVTGFPLTLSIGSSHWDPAAPRPLEQVLAEADRRMYEDKRRHSRTDA